MRGKHVPPVILTYAMFFPFLPPHQSTLVVSLATSSLATDNFNLNPKS